MGFLEKLRDKVKETFYFARFISPGKEKKHFRSTKIALAVSLLITFFVCFIIECLKLNIQFI